MENLLIMWLAFCCCASVASVLSAACCDGLSGVWLAWHTCTSARGTDNIRFGVEWGTHLCCSSIRDCDHQPPRKQCLQSANQQNKKGRRQHCVHAPHATPAPHTGGLLSQTEVMILWSCWRQCGSALSPCHVLQRLTCCSPSALHSNHQAQGSPSSCSCRVPTCSHAMTGELHHE